MLLNDADFKRLTTSLVSPFRAELVQPSSYDLTLSDEIRIPKVGARIDLRKDDPGQNMDSVTFVEHVVKPGCSLLASTVETVKCPRHLSARVDGKSSIGRLFMAVHVTAGVVDAGWEGQITLEIVNHGVWEVVLWAGMPIAQLSYFQLTGECQIPYGSSNLGSHYHGQRGPTPAVGKRSNRP